MQSFLVCLFVCFLEEEKRAFDFPSSSSLRSTSPARQIESKKEYSGHTISPHMTPQRLMYFFQLAQSTHRKQYGQRPSTSSTAALQTTILPSTRNSPSHSSTPAHLPAVLCQHSESEQVREGVCDALSSVALPAMCPVLAEIMIFPHVEQVSVRQQRATGADFTRTIQPRQRSRKGS